MTKSCVEINKIYSHTSKLGKQQRYLLSQATRLQMCHAFPRIPLKQVTSIFMFKLVKKTLAIHVQYMYKSVDTRIVCDNSKKYIYFIPKAM